MRRSIALGWLFFAACQHDFITPKPGGPDGLVAWYPMDDNLRSGNMFDYSSHGLDGVCVGSECPTSVSGPLGAAFEFDGAQRITVADDGQLQQLNGFTVTVWVGPNSSDRLSGTVLAKSRANSPGASWELAFTETLIRFYMDDDKSGDTALERAMPSPIPAWLHVALSWDGTDRHLVIDGGPPDTGGKSAVFDLTALEIGTILSNDIPVNHAHARIDDVRIYDRALSSSEIREIFELPRSDAAARRR